MMAGTMLRLRKAGVEIHMWSLANGCYGSDSPDGDETARVRWEEARSSAALAGATLHRPLVNDLEILYDTSLVASVCARIREVRPAIILAPAPDDYMEDHVNTSRLAVTAAFARGMKAYATFPPVEAWDGATAIYHAMPHGLRDGLGRLVHPWQFVDIGPVLETKREMLLSHRSQERWLSKSQGVSAIDLMVRMSHAVGEMSGRFQYAEGWRRHSILGFAPEGFDPLPDALGEACWTDPGYEESRHDSPHHLPSYHLSRNLSPGPERNNPQQHPGAEK